MVPELVKLVHHKPRPRLRGRDFSRTSHRAPATVKRLTQAYNEPPTPRLRIWRWFAALIVVVALGGYVLLGPLFTVRNVIIIGAPSPSTEASLHQAITTALSGRYGGLVPRSNLLLMSKQRLSEAMAGSVVTEEFSIDRRFPNVLRVSLPAKAYIAVWQSGETQFIMDQRGILSQVVPNGAAPPELVIVRDIAATARTVGETAAQKPLITFLQLLPTVWQQLLPSVPLSHLEFETANLPSVRVVTGAGWYVLMSTVQPPDVQLSALARLLVEKINDHEHKLEYIDVRFGSKLYYRLR